MKKYLVLLLSLLLYIISFSGCGGSVSAPPGSTITINPATVAVTDEGTTATHTQYFTILVKDSNGTPLGNIKITISFPWAKPDPSGVVQLYNGNTRVNSPFDAETDEFGTYTLRFDYQSGGLDYEGNLEVRSGSVFGTAEFTVASG